MADTPNHHPTPTDDLLREAIELATRVNRRLSERQQAVSARVPTPPPESAASTRR